LKHPGEAYRNKELPRVSPGNRSDYSWSSIIRSEDAKDDPMKEDTLDDHSIATFVVRKEESVEAALMRCLPSFYATVRTTMGGPGTWEMKPLRYTAKNGRIHVLLRWPTEMVHQWHRNDFSNILRRASRTEARWIGDDIPQDVLDAVHLATWPDGPAAIDEILKHLNALEEDGAESPKPSSKQKARTHDLAIDIPRRKGVRDEDARPVAVAETAKRIHGVMRRRYGADKVLDGSEAVLLGTRTMTKVTRVFVRCNEEARVAITVCMEGGANGMSGIDAKSIVTSDLKELRTVFGRWYKGSAVLPQRANAVTPETPAAVPAASATTPPKPVNDEIILMKKTPAKSTILHPSSYKRALGDGLTAQGVTALLMLFLYLTGLGAAANLSSILAGALLMNLMVIPVARRWGPPAVDRIRGRGPTPLLAEFEKDRPMLAQSDTTQHVPGTVMYVPAPTASATPVDAWTTLATLVEDDDALTERLAAARRECERFDAIATENPTRSTTAEMSSTISRTIPSLSEDLTHVQRHGDDEDVRQAADEVVGIIETIAATARKERLAILGATRDRISTTGRFIETRTGGMGLTSLPEDAARPAGNTMQ
jgi:hypothetical protein